MPGIDFFSLDNSGLDGPDGVKYASGLLTNDNIVMTFYNPQGGTNTQNSLTVPLDFLPDVIVIKRSADATPAFLTYVDTKSPMSGGYTIFNMFTTEFRLDGAAASISKTGFRLPVYAGNTEYFWQAFKTK
ncbi:hypothetical protein HW560_15775 [Paenibacillus sp. E222]|uniref:hypothetical protein n=1 Tax=Paenibacillus sp. E222 TaxID=2748863 RepID=UPI0015C5C9C4|nr:hypothetical protein [Paenibacillus sp. E222]QLG39406.1 hypothetical protein HW560_15775 [Paenibacillus sp. E222]